MKDLLLVGSIPLETAGQVFETFGEPLGAHLESLPDGEVGFRRHWVSRLHFQVFAVHPDIQVLQRPRPEDGIEQLSPRDDADCWRFRVKRGVHRLHFGERGWRLGFAREALTSYFIFRALKEKGVLPRHLRFQVSIPTVLSAAPPRIFADAASCEIVRAAYREALEAELLKIIDNIPHRELAMQWDCSTEVQEAYEGAVTQQVPQTAVSAAIPREVTLGFHLCFGARGCCPRIAPDDLGAAVDLANALIAGCGRRVDWIHLPVPDRSDDDFFAPLRSLRPGSARIYLGMVHNMPRFRDRLRTARKYLHDFGVAALCGFGRMPREELPRVLKEHEDAVRALVP